MPQYELMYLLGSNVADTEVPTISAQILKFAEEFGATEIRETQLGKKKLAYPIKKTRNGHYVVVNFTMDGQKVNLFEARIHAMGTSVIRYILINLEEFLARSAKDKIAQAKLTHKPGEEEVVKPVKAAAKTPVAKESKEPKAPLVEIDEKALDEKIEAALTEDVTK